MKPLTHCIDAGFDRPAIVEYSRRTRWDSDKPVVRVTQEFYFESLCDDGTVIAVYKHDVPETSTVCKSALILLFNYAIPGDENILADICEKLDAGIQHDASMKPLTYPDVPHVIIRREL